MSYKLYSISPLLWHNLLENPADLPMLSLPNHYLCMLAFDEDIKSPCEVNSFCIGECLYIPLFNDWYCKIDETVDPQNPNDDEVHNPPFVEDILKQKFMYKKPAGKVIMWCDANNSYAKYGKIFEPNKEQLNG